MKKRMNTEDELKHLKSQLTILESKNKSLNGRAKALTEGIGQIKNALACGQGIERRVYIANEIIHKLLTPAPESCPEAECSLEKPKEGDCAHQSSKTGKCIISECPLNNPSHSDKGECEHDFGDVIGGPCIKCGWHYIDDGDGIDTLNKILDDAEENVKKDSDKGEYAGSIEHKRCTNCKKPLPLNYKLSLCVDCKILFAGTGQAPEPKKEN